MVIGDRDYGEIDRAEPGINYFSMYIDSLMSGKEMPLTLDEELHPTRVAIRAQKSTSHFIKNI